MGCGASTQAAPAQNRPLPKVVSDKPTRTGPPPPPLPPAPSRALKIPPEADDWQRQLGEEVVASCYATEWAEREAAHKQLTERMRTTPLAGRGTWSAYIGLVSQGLQDKVLPVYSAALDALMELTKLTGTVVGKALNEEQVREAFEPMIPPVIVRASALNPRSSEDSTKALMTLCDVKFVGRTYIGQHLVNYSSSEGKDPTLRPRIELLAQLVQAHGTLDVFANQERPAFEFVKTYIDVTDDKVRKAALELLVHCYRVARKEKRKVPASYIQGMTNCAISTTIFERLKQTDKQYRFEPLVNYDSLLDATSGPAAGAKEMNQAFFKVASDDDHVITSKDRAAMGKKKGGKGAVVPANVPQSLGTRKGGAAPPPPPQAAQAKRGAVAPAGNKKKGGSGRHLNDNDERLMDDILYNS